MEIRFIFIFLVLSFSATSSAKGFWDNVSVEKKALIHLYVEIDVKMPLEVENEKYNSMVVGVFSSDGDLLFASQPKEVNEKNGIRHSFKIAESLISSTSLTVKYGDGLLCESTVFTASLGELLSEN